MTNIQEMPLLISIVPHVKLSFRQVLVRIFNLAFSSAVNRMTDDG